MYMQPTIFTQIIEGSIPCHKIYEDEQTFAFLTINPKQAGHVLVVPKKEVDHLWDLPTEDYQAVFRTVHLVAARIRTVLQPKRVGLQVEGLEVPHAHVHVFPFNTAAEFSAPARSGEPDHAALADMAAKLAF